MLVSFITLGCKVNQYESEAMLEYFKSASFETAFGKNKADVFVINSCSVTQEADKKTVQTLRRIRKNNPDAVIAVTGCMTQAVPDAKEKLKEADIITGNTERAKIVSLVNEFILTKQKKVEIKEHKKDEKFEKMSVSDFSEHTRAFVKIEDGCNRFCSYCIIPYARGRVRSKSLDELKSEIEEIAKNGYREVVLTGINLSCYGSDIGLSLCDAVECVSEVKDILRVRLGSLEPELLDKDTVNRLSKCEKLCNQFHLSLQSGAKETLKRMNRRYTPEEYKEIVNSLRLAFKDAAITTDIMCGFPGETEEEFMESLSFAKEISFARAHVFKYSPRPLTKAYSMPCHVPEKIKEERSRMLIEATNATKRAYHDSFLNKCEKVLFESGDGKGFYSGYTTSYIRVRAQSKENITGKILDVKILSSEDEGLLGEIIL